MLSFHKAYNFVLKSDNSLLSDLGVSALRHASLKIPVSYDPPEGLPFLPDASVRLSFLPNGTVELTGGAVRQIDGHIVDAECKILYRAYVLIRDKDPDAILTVEICDESA